MALRSMTGYAQVRGQHGNVAFTVSMKSVNHRFLDLHLRLPAGSDALEQAVRKLLKDTLHRGHVEVTVAQDAAGGAVVTVNQALVSGYVEAFRKAATDLGVSGEPDLNAIFRINGVVSTAGEIPEDEAYQKVIVDTVENAIAALNKMRELEGAQIEAELRSRLQHMLQVTEEIEKFRGTVLEAYVQKIRTRLDELMAQHVDQDRILQEAALLAERSDIHEEIVRMKSHIQHFEQLLTGSETGKKMDFLLQEMNREANTMLSKTSGVSGEALRITELGLALKADVEKVREQVQNVE